MTSLREKSRKPYLIEGGGHGNLGTEAYVRCYREITEQERCMGIRFDYVFHASGTGTTQAGLICGQLLAGDDERKIVGISIARKNPRGRDVILDSIRAYLGKDADEAAVQAATVFTDQYTSGYGRSDAGVKETILDAMKRYGLPLDVTYTGKAFWGMKEWLREQGITGRNILFLHTGGTPLFFDSLR